MVAPAAKIQCTHPIRLCELCVLLFKFLLLFAEWTIFQITHHAVHLQTTAWFRQVIGQAHMIAFQPGAHDAFQRLPQHPGGSPGLAIPDHPPRIKGGQEISRLFIRLPPIAFDLVGSRMLQGRNLTP